MRMRSPRIEPPVMLELGSTAMIPTVLSRARSSRASAVTSVDLPEPAAPVMPMTCAPPPSACRRLRIASPSGPPRFSSRLMRRAIDGTWPSMARSTSSSSLLGIDGLVEEGALVDHAPGLELGALERARRDGDDRGGDAERAAQGLLGARREGVDVGAVAVLGAYRELVHRLLAGDQDPVLATVVGQPGEDLVDRGRIHVLAADGEHVVDAAVD